MKNFIFGGLATILVVAAIGGAFYFGQKTAKTPSETQTTQKEVKLGSDTDEHGCKPSAGYSWCEVKKNV